MDLATSKSGIDLGWKRLALVGVSGTVAAFAGLAVAGWYVGLRFPGEIGGSQEVWFRPGLGTGYFFSIVFCVGFWPHAAGAGTTGAFLYGCVRGARRNQLLILLFVWILCVLMSVILYENCQKPLLNVIRSTI